MSDYMPKPDLRMQIECVLNRTGFVGDFFI